MTTIPLPALPGVLDLSPMHRIYAGRPEQRRMFVDLVRLACERIPADLVQARLAWERGEAAQAAGLLHGLRGGIGWMGAKRFDAAALALELALADGGGAVEQGFADCEAALGRTLAAAHAWLAAEAAPAP